MSTLCTDAACSSNAAIAKCTEATAPECYRYIIMYSRTSMTQHGCTIKGFTATALRSYGPMPNSVAPEYKTVTVQVTPSSTPTLTPSTDASPNLGAIVGGTIGGCSVLSVIVLFAFLLHRRRRKARESLVSHSDKPDVGVVEYDPHGFPTPTIEAKWQQHQGPVPRANDAAPQYPGMGAARYGVVEVDGLQRAVEAPADNVYFAREYVRSPM
jgi:hypothetical protein